MARLTLPGTWKPSSMQSPDDLRRRLSESGYISPAPFDRYEIMVEG